MKIKRFITEYANYKKQEIENNDLMQESFKEIKLEEISKVLHYSKMGFITVDEAINKLMEV